MCIFCMKCIITFIKVFIRCAWYYYRVSILKLFMGLNKKCDPGGGGTVGPSYS